MMQQPELILDGHPIWVHAIIERLTQFGRQSKAHRIAIEHNVTHLVKEYSRQGYCQHHLIESMVALIDQKLPEHQYGSIAEDVLGACKVYFQQRLSELG